MSKTFKYVNKNTFNKVSNNLGQNIYMACDLSVLTDELAVFLVIWPEVGDQSDKRIELHVDDSWWCLCLCSSYSSKLFAYQVHNWAMISSVESYSTMYLNIFCATTSLQMIWSMYQNSHPTRFSISTNWNSNNIAKFVSIIDCRSTKWLGLALTFKMIHLPL